MVPSFVRRLSLLSFTLCSLFSLSSGRLRDCELSCRSDKTTVNPTNTHPSHHMRRWHSVRCVTLTDTVLGLRRVNAKKVNLFHSVFLFSFSVRRRRRSVRELGLSKHKHGKHATERQGHTKRRTNKSRNRKRKRRGCGMPYPSFGCLPLVRSFFCWSVRADQHVESNGVGLAMRLNLYPCIACY